MLGPSHPDTKARCTGDDEYAPTASHPTSQPLARSLPLLGAQGLQELLSVAVGPEPFPDAQVLLAATDPSAGAHFLQLVLVQ
jgi:hypothetical protein